LTNTIKVVKYKDVLQPWVNIMNAFADFFLNQPKEWRSQFECDPGLVLSRELEKDEFKEMSTWLHAHYPNKFKLHGNLAEFLWKKQRGPGSVMNRLDEDAEFVFKLFDRDLARSPIKMSQAKNFETRYVVQLNCDRDRLLFKLTWG
jgi:hypothetical protein